MNNSFPISSPVEVTGNNLTPAQINFSDGTNFIEVKAPARISGNQIITLPDDSGTIITSEGIEPLTNKTITDSTNDVTARAIFSDSGANTVSVFSAVSPVNGQVLTATNSNTAIWQFPTGGANINDWTIYDIKSAGTNGGSFFMSAWRTRQLNIISKPPGAGTEVRLAATPATSNQILVEDGTYKIFATAPADGVDEHKARLFNITDGVAELIGTTNDTRTNRTSVSIITGYLNVSGGPKVYEIQHRCLDTRTNTGFGVASGFATVEVYTIINFVKLI